MKERGESEADFVERSLRYLDGSAEGEDLRRFADELVSSPLRRKQFSSLVLDVTALVEIGAEEKALPRRLLRRAPRTRMVLWSGVAMATLLVLGVAIRRKQQGEAVRVVAESVATNANPTPVKDHVPRDRANGAAHVSGAWVERIRGTVRVGRGGTIVEMSKDVRVDVSEGIETVGAQSHVRLRLTDGALLDLQGDTSIAGLADAGSVVLERGAVDVRVTGPAFTVHTAMATASGGPGTRFVFALSSNASRIEVRQGRVVIRDTIRGSSVGVEVGQVATLSTSSALVVGSSAKVAVLIVGRLPKSDSLYQEHLAARGFRVVRVVEAELEARDLENVALVVVSPSVTAAALDATLLRDLPVPLINSEPLLYGGLAMGHPLAPGEQGFIKKLSHVEITAPGHPMAGGLTGTAPVTTLPTFLGWGRPASGAIVVAKLAGQPDRPALFGYERGAAMVSLSAPARRVGMFLHPASALVLTEVGWQLFDAAVKWAISPVD